MHRPMIQLTGSIFSAVLLLSACSGDPESGADTTTTTSTVWGGMVAGGGSDSPKVDSSEADSSESEATDTAATDTAAPPVDTTPLPDVSSEASAECRAMLDFFQVSQDGWNEAITAQDVRDNLDSLIPLINPDIQPSAILYADTTVEGLELMATYGGYDEMMADESGVLAHSDIFFLNTAYNEAYEELFAHVNAVCEPGTD